MNRIGHFGPDQIQILQQAYHQALHELTEETSDHVVPARQVRRLLARLIIEAAGKGQSDPQVLSETALKVLESEHLPKGE
ncbi:hypothetical protein [Microvirga flavescens]|uniref:hypothetical protein n=1 Tax=Microvirga flavescens TaxID=2249811 RepID=UPI000DD8E7EB|nr:hypothetical protein [Microvirga flavescens]